MTPRDLIRVLVIDDSAFSRKAITRMLSTSPLVEVVGVARDGEEALRKAFELRPDLITLDLGLPEIDGLEVAKLLSGSTETPVLVVSAYVNDDVVKQQLAQVGVQHYLAKPFGLTDLLDAAERAMSE